MAGSVALDQIDLSILRILQQDARASNRALAAAIGIAPSTCRDCDGGRRQGSRAAPGGK